MKLVNIANTGYYGPVIEIHQQKAIPLRRLPKETEITSILYEKNIKSYMEKFRLKDYRQQMKLKLRESEKEENK